MLTEKELRELPDESVVHVEYTEPDPSDRHHCFKGAATITHQGNEVSVEAVNGVFGPVEYEYQGGDETDCDMEFDDGAQMAIYEHVKNPPRKKRAK